MITFEQVAVSVSRIADGSIVLNIPGHGELSMTMEESFLLGHSLQVAAAPGSAAGHYLTVIPKVRPSDVELNV